MTSLRPDDPIVTARCRWCQASILWKKMDSGKIMPCDPKRLLIINDQGEMVRGYSSHWATCPKADEVRKAHERINHAKPTRA